MICAPCFCIRFCAVCAAALPDNLRFTIHGEIEQSWLALIALQVPVGALTASCSVRQLRRSKATRVKRVGKCSRSPQSSTLEGKVALVKTAVIYLLLSLLTDLCDGGFKATNLGLNLSQKLFCALKRRGRRQQEKAHRLQTPLTPRHRFVAWSCSGTWC